MRDLFPPFIRALPEPDSPFPIAAHIAPGGHVLPMFYEVDEELAIPEHAHGAQWGVVLRGSMEMTIAGETHTYRRGDSYYVPDGATHVAVIHGGYAGIDVFADPDRYHSRPS